MVAGPLKSIILQVISLYRLVSLVLSNAAGCDAQRANWPARDHWVRIGPSVCSSLSSSYDGLLPVTMSAAWHGGLSDAEQWAGNSDLRQAITLAVDFWFSRDFIDPSCLDFGGESECPCGTPGLWNTNWCAASRAMRVYLSYSLPRFSNVIGVPDLVGRACVLLNDTLTDPEFGNCTNILERSYNTFQTGIHNVSSITGANGESKIYVTRASQTQVPFSP